MKNKFQREMYGTAVISAAAMAICIILYRIYDLELFFSLAMTAGTIAYHFIMRLAVGLAVNKAVQKKLNAENFWFRPKKFEVGLYRRMKVKVWKNKMPTFIPENFSLRKRTPEEVIQNMCIAEMVHEIIIVLGYASLFFARFTNDWRANLPVFLITSVIAGGIDAVFVIMQRYNRPRLVALQKSLKGNEK